MPYANANQDRLLFVSNYNEQRTWTVLDYFMAVSDASTRISIDENTFLYGPGKLRRAVINYYPADCDPVGTCGQGLCTEGTPIEIKQEIMDISRCFASKKYALRAEDLRLLDTGWTFTDVGRETVNSYMPALRKALSKQIYAEVTMLAGVHADGSEYGPQKLQIVNMQTGVVNPVGRLSIEAEYETLGFQSPYILGGKDVLYWQKMVQSGGLNANGQYLDQVDSSNAWYDQGIGAQVLNDITNGDHVLTIDPQMFKFVTYSKNAGMFRGGVTSFDDFEQMRGTTGPDWGRTTWLDAQTGMVWDLYINYDKCTDIWSWHVELHYDFFVMPPFECVTPGINGIMKWRTCPEVIVDCPTGSPIASPGSGTLYSWTPGDIFPFYASSSNIGGVVNAPNVTVTSIDDLVAMMNDNYSQNVFVKNGSAIQYTGFVELDGNINGDITINFA